jgi:hypothetical protein
MGFKRLQADSGIFVYRSSKGFVILVAYVNDIIFFAANKSFTDEKKTEFMSKWGCRDLGTPTEFLSMRIKKVDRKIFLDQTAYLDKVLK